MLCPCIFRHCGRLITENNRPRINPPSSAFPRKINVYTPRRSPRRNKDIAPVYIPSSLFKNHMICNNTTNNKRFPRIFLVAKSLIKQRTGLKPYSLLVHAIELTMNVPYNIETTNCNRCSQAVYAGTTRTWEHSELMCQFVFIYPSN